MEEAQLATANEFSIPLYFVQINEICYEKNLEWYYSYYENEEKVKMTKQRRLWLRFLLFIGKRRRVINYLRYNGLTARQLRG